MAKRIKKLFSNRMFIGFILVPLQIFLVLFLMKTLSGKWVYVYRSFLVISYITLIWLIKKDDNPAYKIPWMLVILIFPPFGSFFYLFWGNTPLNSAKKKMKMKKININYDNTPLTPATEEFITACPKYARNGQYIASSTSMHVFKNTRSKYYDIGEKKFIDLLSDLKNAKKFIFIESFIIKEGTMWSSILNILVEKAQQGVDVRVMYDDVGCMTALPKKYDKYLTSLGIKTVCFNRFIPIMNSFFNYRDHKKICVIDGNIGYTGGTNIGDEYINKVVRFGHWKDTDVRIEGEAVVNLTLSFLHLWSFSKGKNEVNYLEYFPTTSLPSDDYVQFFDDTPFDNYNHGEGVYMQLINRAEKYVYITSPYLVLDNEMITALITAAQSGIDVRIITPGIPDKNYVFCLTRSYYNQLVNAGVKIYEYTPGFFHGKMIVVDDDTAVIGTINMDFRSFYMHFECGAAYYGGQIPLKIKEDILDAITYSHQITQEWVNSTSFATNIKAAFLRILSPLL